MKKIVPFLLLIIFTGCSFNQKLKPVEPSPPAVYEKQVTKAKAKDKIVYKNQIENINVSLLKNNLSAGDKLVFKIKVEANYLPYTIHLPFELELFKDNRRLAKVKKNIIIDKKSKTTTIKLPVKKGLEGKYSYEFTFLKYAGIKREGLFFVGK